MLDHWMDASASALRPSFIAVAVLMTTRTIQGERVTMIKDSIITQSINTIIQIEMEKRNLSRADMARALGVSPVTVTVALNDRARDWKITTLDDWANALNCDLHIEFRARPKTGNRKKVSTPSGEAETGQRGRRIVR